MYTSSALLWAASDTVRLRAWQARNGTNLHLKLSGLGANTGSHSLCLRMSWLIQLYHSFMIQGAYGHTFLPDLSL